MSDQETTTNEEEKKGPEALDPKDQDSLSDLQELEKNQTGTPERKGKSL